MVHPSQRPCNLNDTYDWEGGLTDRDEERLYDVVPKLQPIGKVSLKELKFILEIYASMVQLEKNVNYSSQHHQHELGETLILDEFVDITIKN